MAINFEKMRFTRDIKILARRLLYQQRIASSAEDHNRRMMINSSSSWLQPNLELRYQQWSGYSTLPKLPVPPLRQTLSRLLAVAKPLASSKQEFDQFTKLVEEFGRPNGQGERLQGLLEKRAAGLSNWLSDWWLDKAYLEPRYPLLINVSPGMLMPMQAYQGLDGQVKFAAKLIAGVLSYKNMIDKNELGPEMAGSHHLDMSQYELLFGTTRIPGEKKDWLRYGCKEPVKSSHVIVARNNRFFAVPVYSAKGELLSEAQIEGQLKDVVAGSEPRAPVSDSVGLMTTEDRNVWGKLYSCMKGTNDMNAASLDLIETSVFLVCLDQEASTKSAVDSTSNLVSSKLNAVGGQLLHGGGSNANTGNRWFDKCLQFVVGYDGGCGITYEHSPAEGPPVASLLDYTIDYVGGKNGKAIRDSTSPYQPPAELEFVLTESDRNRVRSAAQKIDKLINDVEVYVLSFDHFGKELPKAQKISPDSFVQLGFQLAFHKLHGECPSTYETGTLRRFKLGRTDTIRLPTAESVHFVHSMLDKTSSPLTKAQALRKAVQSHKDYTAAACSGNGIDRHLLGLKLLAIETGEPTPSILTSEIYQKMIHFKLSTSQVTSKHDACMFFGPMYPDCYGACYNPRERKIMVGISAFNSYPQTSAKKFAQVLTESFLEMRDVLVTAGAGGEKTMEKSKL